MDTEPDLDALAAPHPCSRCGEPAMLSVVGFCAACVADMGLRHPDEYASFKSAVSATYGRK
ncbi:hypothetical protein BJF78_08280 [Pseudonocardia sp. CNS-139]|nr:hypothetical protein BJF78_08280 [Pseudonocardia sp. CNS-139]